MISRSCMETLDKAISREDGGPFVEIMEQPASKALRFRYECEGRSAGSIPGVSSCTKYKTYPTIRLHNYRGRAIAVVSCVTKDQPYRSHPHSLVGKSTCKSGVCRVEIAEGNPMVSFSNLGIQCVKKRDIADALRKREKMRVDPFGMGFEHKRQPGSVDLNVVRLCFQVFIEGREGKLNVPLEPVVSAPIYDKKAISDLTICKLSHYSASVAGGMEMIILCEKVAKDNIQVIFFEKRDGRRVWENNGDFKYLDVHKQTAISLRTPSYQYQDIEEALPVFIQLRRPSDGLTSEAVPFQYLPLGTEDRDNLGRKRRKFDNTSRAQVLRSIQVEAENHIISPNEPIFESNVDSLKLDARVHWFSNRGGICNTEGAHSMFGNIGTAVQSPISLLDASVPSYGDQDSPVSLPSPAIGYSLFNAMPGGTNQQNNMDEKFESANQGYLLGQQSLGVNQMECSQYPNYYHQQSCNRDQQEAPVLQKLTIPQESHFQNGNGNQQGLQSAIGEPDLMDIPGPSQASFDTSLNQLDSAELAAFGVALSETFSSGLSITDYPVKIENNMAVGTMPVSVGAAASWCNV